MSYRSTGPKILPLKGQKMRVKERRNKDSDKRKKMRKGKLKSLKERTREDIKDVQDGSCYFRTGHLSTP